MWHWRQPLTQRHTPPPSVLRVWSAGRWLRLQLIRARSAARETSERTLVDADLGWQHTVRNSCTACFDVSAAIRNLRFASRQWQLASGFGSDTHGSAMLSVSSPLWVRRYIILLTTDFLITSFGFPILPSAYYDSFHVCLKFIYWFQKQRKQCLIISDNNILVNTGHVCRADSTQEHSRALRARVSGLPKNRNRKPGRLRQTWRRTVEGDLRSFNLGLASA